MLVFDGANACMRDWSMDGTPPPGFVKKIQHVSAFQMPNLKEGSKEWRNINEIVEKFNKLPGITAMFNRLGSQKLNGIIELAKDAEWHDLPYLTANFTHGLILVADGLKEYKEWLHSKFKKKEWAEATDKLIQQTVSIDCQLGMDIVKPTNQRDPMIACCFLRLNMEHLGEESELWPHIFECLEKFNEVPGVRVSFSPIGYTGFSWEEWLKEVWSPDKSFGTSFMMTVVANNPICFKRWRHCETFGAWGAILGHAFIRDEMTPILFLPLPLEITTRR